MYLHSNKLAKESVRQLGGAALTPVNENMQESIKVFESQANFRNKLRKSGQYNGFRIKKYGVLANRFSAVNDDDDFIIRRSLVMQRRKFSSMCQCSINLLASGNYHQPE